MVSAPSKVLRAYFVPFISSFRLVFSNFWWSSLKIQISRQSNNHLRMHGFDLPNINFYCLHAVCRCKDKLTTNADAIIKCYDNSEAQGTDMNKQFNNCMFSTNAAKTYQRYNCSLYWYLISIFIQLRRCKQHFWRIQFEFQF